MPERPAFRNLVHVRVEPDLRVAIEAAAQKSRLTLSEYMRRGLRAHVAGGRGIEGQARHA